MQAAARTWRQYRPHLLAPLRTPLRVRPDVLKNTPPLYDRRPPWWARFTYTFIFADLFVTAAMAELVFDTWTQEVSESEDAPSTETKDPTVNRRPDAPTSTDTTPSTPDANAPPAPKTYALRPLWQRAPIALAQLGVGVGIALMLLTSHARVVRQLRILPASAFEAQANSSGRLVRPAPTTSSEPSATQTQTRAQLPTGKATSQAQVQSPAQGEERFLTITSASRSTGTFPLSSCSLSSPPSSSSSDANAEVLLTVHGVRGTFWLGLPSARVNGEKEPRGAWAVKEALYGAVYGEGEGRRRMAREGWVEGPVGAGRGGGGWDEVGRA